MEKVVLSGETEMTLRGRGIRFVFPPGIAGHPDDPFFPSTFIRRSAPFGEESSGERSWR